MNRKRLFRCFALMAGLVVLPAAGVLAGDGSTGAAALATDVSSVHRSDADGAVLPAGVTPTWWARAQAAIRQLQPTNQDLAARFNPRPSWKAEGNQVDAYFGLSVGTAGDVNGDGYDDVIVGAPYYSNGQSGEGRAFVYHGSATGLSKTPDWTAESDQAGAYFGVSVTTAGDVNGDGYDDIIVGAPYYSNGQSGEGRAFVYHGSATGLSTTPDWTAEGNQEGADFGYSVATAGDVNGDGYDDVVVGADVYSNDQVCEGRAFAYHGSATGLSTTPDWTAGSDQEFASFGVSLGRAGDVNGDGYDDVIIGASGDSNGQVYEGRAFVYLGSSPGLDTTPRWTPESDQESAYFGNSVGTAGDVNGDGYDDVIGGAPYYDHGQSDEGVAVVFRGRATMPKPR